MARLGARMGEALQHRLWHDRRGATLVEYLILAGCIALVAAAGVRVLGHQVNAKADAQAACVLSLDCEEAPSGAAGGEAPVVTMAAYWEAVQGVVVAAIGGGESTVAVRAQQQPTTAPDRQALVDELYRIARCAGAAVDYATVEAMVDGLLAGDASDAERALLYAYFAPLGLDGSHAAMDVIRGAGLLDPFLDATLRAPGGGPVDPRVRAAVRLMMETGRLDPYAETLASVPIGVYDPADPAFAYAGGNHHYTVLNGQPVVYFNGNLLDDLYASQPYDEATRALAATMAHEVFHAYGDAHGMPYGAVNEGMGIAAIGYAYGDDPLDIAEMIYGTKNFYRDGLAAPDYPLVAVDRGAADAELVELLDAFSTRDVSGVAWDDQAQLDADYQAYWENLTRVRGVDTDGDGDIDVWDDANWVANAAQATRQMAADGVGGTSPPSGAGATALPPAGC